MEFLYKLYDMEYFGIGIFIVITILTLLFLVILFFGKKDEKQRKIEETKELGLNDFVQENADLKDMSIPEIEQPIIENTIVSEKEETPVFENPIEEPTVEENIEEIPAVEEVETDNVVMPEDINIEPIDIEGIIQSNEEDAITPVEDVTLDEIVEPEQSIEEPTNIFEEPTVEESNIFENTDEEPKEETKTTSMFELPKMATESPKKDEEKEEQTELESSIDKATDFDSLFGDIESETYNIK